MRGLVLTKQEKRIIAFVLLAFVIGSAVRIWRQSDHRPAAVTTEHASRPTQPPASRN
jgi:hypothetical protein